MPFVAGCKHGAWGHMFQGRGGSRKPHPCLVVYIALKVYSAVVSIDWLGGWLEGQFKQCSSGIISNATVRYRTKSVRGLIKGLTKGSAEREGEGGSDGTVRIKAGWRCSACGWSVSSGAAICGQIVGGHGMRLAFVRATSSSVLQWMDRKRAGSTDLSLWLCKVGSRRGCAGVLSRCAQMQAAARLLKCRWHGDGAAAKLQGHLGEGRSALAGLQALRGGGSRAR